MTHILSKQRLMLYRPSSKQIKVFKLHMLYILYYGHTYTIHILTYPHILVLYCKHCPYFFLSDKIV
jgi:hypothetical protein